MKMGILPWGSSRLRPGEEEEDVKRGFCLWVWAGRYGVWSGYTQFGVSMFSFFFLGAGASLLF
jgi:hypothetical protein